MFVLELLGWFIFSCILMSFVEHQVHSQLMHRANFLSRRKASFKKTFEAHAIVHHQYDYGQIFQDEPVPPGEDKEIRLTVRKAWIKALPVAIPIAFFSIPGAVILCLTVTLHHWIWNQIHLEMHKPEDRAFSQWPVYKLLARYHFLHHKHPNKNFNVVFPLADFILGTHVKANDTELRELYELGYLTPAQAARVRAMAPVASAERKPVGAGSKSAR